MAGPIDLAAARRKLLAALPTCPGEVRSVRCAQALGAVLAEPVLAPRDLPDFDRSLVDGFAVRCIDGPRLRLAAGVAMGRPAGPLAPGTAAPVPTGGMIPAGADAMVMKEDAVVDGGVVGVRRAAAAGDHVVRRGADARAGALLLPAGRRLRPSELALLASAGVTSVRVRPRPRIAVLSTGDELVPAGAVPAPGQVPDSNGPALCAALARDGAEPEFLGIVPDVRAALVAAVRRGLDADALLCSGGSSVGEHDFVQGVLEEVLGVPPLFSGISIRPGRPTAAFVSGVRWAVALPGHAVSALVVYDLILREAVRRFAGEDSPAPRGVVEARLAARVAAPPDRDLYERVRLDDGLAVPLRGASATVGNLARADALVCCPAGQVLEAGSVVAAAPLD